MQDHYYILGVSRTASSSEIKAAYRKLVIQYHPDKNPDPAAQEKIRAINRAYDILSDDGKRAEYDRRMSQGWLEMLEDETPPHRDPRYRRKRPTNYPRPPAKPTQYELMKQYLPYALWACYIGLLFTILIGLDRLIPQKTRTETVEEIYTVRSGRLDSYRHDLLVTGTGRKIIMYNREARQFSEEPVIKIQTTFFLSIPMSVTNEADRKFVRLGYIYRNQVFFPVILFIASLMGVVFRKKVHFAFNLTIICTVFFFINLYSIFHR